MSEHSRPHAVPKFSPHTKQTDPSLSLVTEGLVAVEVALLGVSPVYWGWGIPRGDGSAVIVVPGLGASDLYLTPIRTWLARIGYRPYASATGVMASCPNRIAARLKDTIEKAFQDTGRRVHLIGHSMGGIFSRVIATQIPDRIASVISLGSPLRAVEGNEWLLTFTDLLQAWVHLNEPHLPSDCATPRCGCPFAASLWNKFPAEIEETVIYSKIDNVVAWKQCLTRREGCNIEVSSTHIGMPFNAEVYWHIARRLARARTLAAPTSTPAGSPPSSCPNRP